MQQYLIVIITLINSKRFKFNQKLLNIFCILQLLLIFFIFFNNQKFLFLNILDYFRNTFIIIFNKLKGAFL